jgi:hypothetical protein
LKTRTFQIGAKKVIISNIPDDFPDEEARKLALLKLLDIYQKLNRGAAS